MVDELGDDDAKIQENGMTLRDKLEAHRSHRACAGCHSRIDPLGFPLENFDAIGKWRESYGRFPVDATGSLWGTEYSNVVEFKDLLRTEKGFFHRGFIRHMMTYALGRELHHYDEPSIDNLLSGLEKGQGLQDLIVAIATSPTFTHAR